MKLNYLLFLVSNLPHRVLIKPQFNITKLRFYRPQRKFDSLGQDFILEFSTLSNFRTLLRISLYKIPI